jgi:16S rRNA G966 N2-methylase RsmD
VGGQAPRNKLNDLTAREWMQFTKSWFVCNPPPRSRRAMLHPAKFPEPMAEEFIRFFTKAGETVLDPFAGVGSALAAAARCGRRAVGVELCEQFVQLARPHAGPGQTVLRGDARQAVQLCRNAGIDSVHYIITSPPYWDMLAKSRGNVQSAHKDRAKAGLPIVYSSDPADLATIADYDQFLAELAGILASLKVLLAPMRYLTVVVQNVRVPTGEVRPMAWDLCRLLSEQYTFKGERLWLQDNKRLGIWGYPAEFVTNVHHHYCLTLRNDKL